MVASAVLVDPIRGLGDRRLSFDRRSQIFLKSKKEARVHCSIQVPKETHLSTYTVRHAGTLGAQTGFFKKERKDVMSDYVMSATVLCQP